MCKRAELNQTACKKFKAIFASVVIKKFCKLLVGDGRKLNTNVLENFTKDSSCSTEMLTLKRIVHDLVLVIAKLVFGARRLDSREHSQSTSVCMGSSADCRDRITKAVNELHKKIQD